MADQHAIGLAVGQALASIIMMHGAGLLSYDQYTAILYHLGRDEDLMPFEQLKSEDNNTNSSGCQDTHTTSESFATDRSTGTTLVGTMKPDRAQHSPVSDEILGNLKIALATDKASKDTNEADGLQSKTHQFDVAMSCTNGAQGRKIDHAVPEKVINSKQSLSETKTGKLLGAEKTLRTSQKKGLASSRFSVPDSEEPTQLKSSRHAGAAVQTTIDDRHEGPKVEHHGPNNKNSSSLA
ncbi:hypothetical protein F4778DRAFT_782619 [Xylariomycetidae sp. FL2044]|nr:hypothetical protein F4778DRAFT_782619 [Xylariomycetidae sp. FL2044]